MADAGKTLESMGIRRYGPAICEDTPPGAPRSGQGRVIVASSNGGRVVNTRVLVGQRTKDELVLFIWRKWISLRGWLSHTAAGAVRLMARLFRDREVMLRSDGRIRYVHLGPKIQILGFAIMMAVLGYAANILIVYASYDRIIAAKDRVIDSTQSSYAALFNQFTTSEARFRSVAKNLEAKHAHLLSLIEQNKILKDDLASIRNKLWNSEQTGRRILASRQALKQQLARLDGKLQGAVSSNQNLAGNLQIVESALQSAIDERGKTIEERDLLQTRINQVRKRLAHLQDSQQKVLDRLSERTMANINQVKGLVAMTGLKAEKFLGGFPNSMTGQGGPFIAASPNSGDAEEFETSLADLNKQINHWEGLQRLLRSLPLTAPSDHFYISSRFGKRIDPIKKKWSRHYGLDLAGVFKSPVLATAPGIVVSVTHHSKYGRMVEIDHGQGIHTRYGHLHRILVRRKQKVGFRQKIGLMGNTGRSTGTHVHYEIKVNGKPYDPMKFMEAGKYVFKR